MMSYGYMVLSHHQLNFLEKIRGFNFTPVDAGAGWFAWIRMDEGGTVARPLQGQPRLTAFGCEFLRALQARGGGYFCNFLLDKHTDVHDVAAAVQRGIRENTVQELSLKPGTPLVVGAAYALPGCG